MDTYCQFLSKNSTRPVSLRPPESQGVGCHFSAHYRATVCLIGVTKQHLGRAHTKIPSSSLSTCIHFNVIFIQKSLVVTFLLQQKFGRMPVTSTTVITAFMDAVVEIKPRVAHSVMVVEPFQWIHQIKGSTCAFSIYVCIQRRKTNYGCSLLTSCTRVQGSAQLCKCY